MTLLKTKKMKANNRRWGYSVAAIIISGVIVYKIMVIGAISTMYHNDKETLTPIEIHEEYFCPDIMLYEYTLDFIKRCEGYVPYRYLCPAGKVTIGYGHRIYPGDTLTWLTEHQADSVLRVDFDFYMDWVSDYYKDIEYNKQIALAHFAFCCGEGALRNMYENQCIYNALKYHHYRDMNGNIIKSEYMEIIRKFNVDMYNEHIFR